MNRRGVQTCIRQIAISWVEKRLESDASKLRPLFQAEEWLYCREQRRRPAQHLAVRLAAKLAARRLLGGGRLVDFVVARDRLGAPHLSYVGVEFDVERLYVSLSHEGAYAVAFVAMEVPYV